MPTNATTKLRSLIFNTDEVRAVQAGMKSAHSLPMKPQPEALTEGPLVHARRKPAPYVDLYNRGEYACWWTSDDRQGPGWYRCPLGSVGDVLYVREPWQNNFSGHVSHNGLMYKATAATDQSFHGYWAKELPDGTWVDHYDRPFEWRAAETMPEYAARIFLQIESIKVKRAQDVTRSEMVDCGWPESSRPIDSSGTDKRCIGVTEGDYIKGHAEAGNPNAGDDAVIEWFAADIDRRSPGAWDRNDWLWLVTWKQVPKPEGM